MGWRGTTWWGGQEELQQRASALEAERARLVDEHKAELEKLAKAKVAHPPTFF